MPWWIMLLVYPVFISSYWPDRPHCPTQLPFQCWLKEAHLSSSACRKCEPLNPPSELWRALFCSLAGLFFKSRAIRMVTEHIRSDAHSSGAPTVTSLTPECESLTLCGRLCVCVIHSTVSHMPPAWSSKSRAMTPRAAHGWSLGAALIIHETGEVVLG